jgi:hypothetical protein
MRSVGLAMGYDIWRRGKRSFLLFGPASLLFFALLLTGIFARMIPRSGQSDPWRDERVYQFAVLLFTLVETMMGSYLVGQTMVQVRGWRVGFPQRLYTMPMTTRRLVFWSLLWGVVAMIAMQATGSAVLALVSGHWPPMVVPMLYQTVLLTWLLAIFWALTDFMVVRLVALGALAVGAMQALVLAAQRMTPGGRTVWGIVTLPSLWEPPAAWTVVSALALIGAAWVVAVAGVARDRRGDAQGWPGLRALWSSGLDRLPRRRRRLRSPAAAQFWFEWRCKGWPLPTIMVFAELVVVAVSVWNRSVSGLLLAMIVLPFFLVPIGAFAMGAIVGRLSEITRHPELDLFRATRPLADRSLALANLKVGGASILAAWAVALTAAALTALVMVLGGQGHVVRQEWGRWIRDVGVASNEIVSFLFLMALTMLIAWVMLGSLATLAMAGHRKLMTGLTAGAVAIILVLVLAWPWIGAASGARIARIAVVVLGLALILSSLGSIALTRLRRLVSDRFFAFSLAGCVLALIAGVWTASLALSAVLDPNQSVPQLIVFWLGIFAVAPALPSLAALAMAWNRHR